MSKKCPRCETAKDAKDFWKNKSQKDGLACYCIECAREYNRDWWKSPAGKRQMKSANYKEHQRRKDKRRQHTEKRKRSNKRYTRSTKWSNAQRRHKYLRRSASGEFSGYQWYRLCGFYQFTCLKCKKRLPYDKLEVDHIKPISKGGTNYISNLQPLCKSCNSSKGDKEIDYREILPNWIKRDGPVWLQGTLF